MSRLWSSWPVRLATVGASALFIATILIGNGGGGRPTGGPAAPNGAGTSVSGGSAGEAFVVATTIRHDLSKPLRAQKPVTTPGEKEEGEDEEEPGIANRDEAPAPAVPTVDPALQPAGTVASTSVSTTVANFEGVNNRNGVLPPDTNGDVGPNHYVQWVNLSLAIYSKTGTLLWGPSNGNVIWNGFGGYCQTNNNGDPIVLYDQAADRWMISQFALPGGANGYHQCIAVSQTGDPTGAWYRYDFLYDGTKMNDYPHFGVWPDGYYMSVNQFNNGSSWGGQGVAVFERDKMLAGLPARMVKFDLYGTDPNLGGMLPSDLDGANPPPAGTPNSFVLFDDDAWGYSPDQLQVWDFHVDWSNTANSTFTKKVALATAAFDSNLAGIQQPGTTVRLQTLNDRLMYRLQYRNFGDHQSLVVDHSVDVNGADRGGIRWYELRSTGGAWSIFQQGTFSPDATNRWMGSAAMNGAGGIAIGYSLGSSTTYPSIRYTGRLSTDPLGTLPQGEGTVIDGGGSQTHSAARWGDYAMLAVDPVDDCTFWFTTEYMAATSLAGWQTRIASFTLPDCSATPPTTGSIGGSVTDSSTTAALGGATVTLNNGATTTTAADGTYAFSGLAVGAYDVSASKAGYVANGATGVGVVAGQSTTVNLALAPIPTYTTAYFYPAAFLAISSSAGDNNGYEGTPTNLLTSNGLFGTDVNSGTANGTSCTATTRDKENFSGFSFGVPTASSVKGLQVRLSGKVSATNGSPRFCVLLSSNGGLTWTAGKTTTALTKTAGIYTLGTTIDTWGRSWTSADLGTNFRVRIVDLANSTKTTFSLDYVSVAVTYQ